MVKSSKVFISYAHGDRSFQDRVLSFADRLEILGLEVILDQYEPNPNEGWTKWMEKGVRKADFVLCICTQKYFERVNEEQPPDSGQGVMWEGSLLYNLLNSEPDQRKKVQIIQFDEQCLEHIPLPIRGNNRFLLTKFGLNYGSFEDLYRVLTDQPKITRPDRGEIVELPTRSIIDLQVLPAIQRTATPRSGVDASQARLQMDESFQEPLSIYRSAKIPKLAGNKPYIQKLANHFLDQALDAYYDHRFNEAIQFSKKASKLDGSLILALELEANIYYELHKWRECSEAYSRFFSKTDSREPDFLIRWHIAQYMNEKKEECKSIIENIASNHLGNINVQLSYSIFLNSCEDTLKAKAAIRSSIKATDSKILMVNLAFLEWHSGNINEANSLLEEIVQKDPNYPEAWTNLAVGRAETGRYGLAIEALLKALELRPRYAFARFALAEIYALMYEPEATVEVLQELVSSEGHFLTRLMERNFDAIRNSEIFQKFLMKMPKELLELPSPI